jgi:cytochrome c biogenesis factor
LVSCSVPRGRITNLNENAVIASSTVHDLKLPRFSVTASECISAVPAPARGMFILAFLVIVIGSSLLLYALKGGQVRSRVQSVIASSPVHDLKLPRFSVTASECISAVPASHGIKGMFILAFLVIVIGSSLLLYALKGGQVRSRVQSEAWSRESFLLGNNVLAFAAHHGASAPAARCRASARTAPSAR